MLRSLQKFDEYRPHFINFTAVLLAKSADGNLKIIVSDIFNEYFYSESATQPKS